MPKTKEDEEKEKKEKERKRKELVRRKDLTPLEIKERRQLRIEAAKERMNQDGNNIP